MLAIAFLPLIIFNTRRISITNSSKIYLLTGSFLLIIVLSSFINDVRPVIAIKSGMALIKPFLYLLFFILVSGLNYDKTVRRIITVSVWIGFINVIVVIFMRVLIGGSYYQDAAKGIMGDAHVAGQYIYLFFVYLTFLIIEKKKYKFTPVLILPLLGFFITETKQLLIFALIFPFLMILKIGRIKLSHTITIVAMIILLFNTKNITNVLFQQQLNIYSQTILEYEELVDYIAVVELITEGFDEMQFYYLGAGPGMYASKTAMEYNTYFYNRYIKYLEEYHDYSGTINDPFNQILTVLSEVGPLGLIIFALILWYLTVTAMQYNANESNSYNLLLLYVYSGLLLHLVGRLIVHETFIMNQSLLLLLFIYPLVSYTHQNKRLDR
jgi:general stress protein CsbA